MHVVLWPVRVQGDGSAEEIVSAIVALGNLTQRSSVPKPDVLIVARGGGSLEDLWSFNDEGVVRAAADCPIPLISAVGHETDWTLLDHVADVRAPTPTAAAEMCVPVRSDLVERIAQLHARRSGAIGRLTRQIRTALISVSRSMPSVKNLPHLLAQRLESLFDSLQAETRVRINAKALVLARVAGRLSRHSPYVRLAIVVERVTTIKKGFALTRAKPFVEARQRLARSEKTLNSVVESNIDGSRMQMTTFEKTWTARRLSEKRLIAQGHRHSAEKATSLRRAMVGSFRQKNASADSVGHVFGTINYKAVLARGFAIVFDNSNLMLTRRDDARKAGKFKVRFFDGEIVVSVGSRPGPRRATRSGRDALQNDLF